MESINTNHVCIVYVPCTPRVTPTNLPTTFWITTVYWY